MEYNDLAEAIELLITELNSNRSPEEFEALCGVASDLGYLVVPHQVDDFIFEFTLNKVAFD